MKYIVFTLLGSLLVFSAKTQQQESISVEDTSCLRLPKDSTDYYFPNNIFDLDNSNNGRTLYLNEWYFGHLFSMEEPIINTCEDMEIFRFTWIRTFHNPIVVRISKKNSTISLVWKKTNGLGGYYTGEIDDEGIKNLSIEDWNKLKKKIKKCKFENLPSAELSHSKDGADWILEGASSNGYHVVNKRNARKTTIGKVCLYLLELTDLEIANKEVY